MKKQSAALRMLHPLKRFGIHLWEKANRLDTAKDFPVIHQHPNKKLMRGYQPSDWKTMKRINQVVGLSRQDVFIDFGSGKGRILYLAARYPLKKIIGVEISEELNAIAKKNLNQHRYKLVCKDIELVKADASDYIPPEDFTIAYFFNPFEGLVFEQVIRNIRNSLLANPRKIWLIYKNPVMKPSLDRCPWLTLEQEAHNTCFYRSLPPPPQP
jgi:SAM-dependent methyltransferase